MSHRSAVLMLLACSILWSLGGVMIKAVDWHPMATAGARSALAAVVIFAWLRRPQWTFSPRQLGAALAYVGTVSFFVIANRMTTAANAIFLQYTAPVYVALASHFFLGERARRADWLCVAMALTGIAMFFGDELQAGSALGMAAGLASGLSFATMVILLRRERDASPMSALLLGNIATAVIGLPFGIGSLPEPRELGVLALLGVFQLGIPYVLYGIAIRRVTAIEAILLPMIEPVLNPIWVVLVHGEVPGTWSLAGAALVLAAVTIRGFAVRR
jgi:drug/metabolite transporter (DMT)-like permease